jgi:opacity protein-like surface antigen
MKKVLIVCMAFAMVCGVSGGVLAGGTVQDECCGGVQTQIDEIKSAYEQNAETTDARFNDMSQRLETQGDPDNFYMTVVGGLNGGVNADTDFGLDDGWQVSFALGNRIQEHIRLEAEYQYLDTDNIVKVNSLMANVYYDFGTWNKITPYATTGIGIGWFDYTDSHVTGDDDSMVWKAGVGVDYAVNDKWSVGARYTYFDAVDDIDYDSNLVGISLTMKF